jgi:hypothetical protein
MRKELKALREQIINELKGEVSTYGYLNAENGTKYFPICNDEDYIGVSTYGAMSDNSLLDCAEADGICCVWVSSKGYVLGRTFSDDVIDITEIPTDDIDRIVEVMQDIRSNDGMLGSCNDWYMDFKNNCGE